MADPIPGAKLNSFDFAPSANGLETYAESGTTPYRVKVGEPNGIPNLDAAGKVPPDQVGAVFHESDYLPAPGPAYLKYTSDILNGMEVPIDIFLDRDEIPAIRDGTSTYNCSADYQTAYNAAGARGIHLLIGPGLYNIPDQVITAADNTHMRGIGRPKLLLAAGKAAGYIPFSIRHNHFSARNMRMEGAVKSHCFYVQPQSAVALTGFTFEGLEGSGLFYMVRGDGAADRLIYDVLVRGCKNVAPIGTNCGHFMVDFGVGIKYLGNTIQNGHSTSGFGVADSKRIVIADNIESGMQDTAGAAEAACQLEDCDAANAVITNNSFEHDIWIAGSNGVVVSGNVCRRMRTSVGNVDGYNVKSVLFANNRAAQIHCGLFGGGTPAERIQARFVGNTLDPAGRTLNGVALSSAIYAEGTYVTELGLQNNSVVSDATANAMVITRAATSEYHLYNNDFGTLAHSIGGGSVGGLYERGNRNKATKTGNGYLTVYLNSLPSITLGAFTTLPFNGETVDVNAEHATGVITIRKSGTYRFKGHITVDPDAAGSEMGFTIKRTSGTPAELFRVADLYAVNGTSHGVPFSTPEIYLTAGDTIELQYRMTGATTTFVVGSNTTWLQMERVD